LPTKIKNHIRKGVVFYFCGQYVKRLRALHEDSNRGRESLSTSLRGEDL
jgi:hypothetical protein